MINWSAYKSNRGQAAMELAVFGAVLIFLIGAIVRNSVAAGQLQNTQLKAMRMALLASYEASKTKTIGRNSTNILYIEDRLSPEVSRYGPGDRSAVMGQGGGQLTNLLYYPLDADELDRPGNLTMMDVYINGVYLPLTTAAKSTIAFAAPGGRNLSYVGSPTAVVPDPRGDGSSHFQNWNFKCKQVTETIQVTNPATGLPMDVVRETWFGCPIFYTISATPGEYGMLSETEAYDLNRDDDFSNDPPTVDGQGKLARTKMAWHWKGVNAIDFSIDPANTYADVDGDGQEEQLFSQSRDINGITTAVTSLDSQKGDIDPSASDRGGITPGLQQDMSIFTKSRDGTYLAIKEGKMYNPETGKLMRSVNFRDQVELMQRMFQLTNDTHRFCDTNGNPTAILPGGEANPVEACGRTGGDGASTCFSPANMKLTCLDQDTLMLFIRTRILDKTGHAWLTDVTGGLP